ncbi:hypothetical protein EWM64_g9914 [Hericium alpestre]|uniref:Reverse transcriptase Ty1/copia-type domain-containing protein n=1 Tax=Hericium alpestre TaxID=135208 RepID=A0A4Y9ZKD1_9AGAM|nr:hypothetical protein EWM64_g9914 [Hericium alpestre]
MDSVPSPGHLAPPLPSPGPSTSSTGDFEHVPVPSPTDSDFEVIMASIDAAADKPCTWGDAQASSFAAEWRQAYLDELASLHHHKVWELVPRSSILSGHRIVKCRPVFKLKRDAAGNPVRFKARLVAKGFTQVPGVDFHETYSPVTRLKSQRLALHIGATHDWEMEQLDVKTAFLHGVLEEEVYMEQPPGFAEPGKEDFICRLLKGLYGLKQGGRAWNLLFDSIMQELGYKRLDCEWCIYYRTHSSGRSIVVVHVDDMNVIADSKAEMARVKSELRSHFDIVELGPVSWLVGLAVARDRVARTVTITQTALVDSVITQFGLQDAHPVSTPLDPNVHLTHADCPSDDASRAEMSIIPYRELIGSLMYLAIGSRPDIAHAVQHLSQFNANPGHNHWHGAKHVARYLKGTRTHGLVLGGLQPLALSGFSDASFGGQPGPAGARRSISGFVFTLGSGAISWSSKRQPVTALSTCESEYAAAAHAAREALWLCNILTLLDFPPPGPVPIACDNQSAIRLTHEQSSHCRSKYFDLDHHFLRDRITLGHISVHYVPTHEMTADILTKTLTRAPHVKFRSALGLAPPAAR